MSRKNREPKTFYQKGSFLDAAARGTIVRPAKYAAGKAAGAAKKIHRPSWL
jgi:hypothetical protein